jgi:hypothetical protein
MAGDAWENIAKKIKEKFELLRYGPYASSCEDLYRDYLEKTYGPEKVLNLLNDDNAWWDFANTPEAKELAAKYGLNWSYLPDGTIWEEFKDLVESGIAPNEPFFMDLFAVKPIPFHKIRWSDLKGRGIDTNKIRFVDGGVDLSSAFTEDTSDIPEDTETDDLEDDGEIPIFLKEGRFIQIEIDLFKPKTQILAEINMQIEFHLGEVRGFLVDESQSNKKGSPLYRGIKVRGPAIDSYLEIEGGTVSIFEVWNMNKKEGKSPWKIAKELYPLIKGKSPREWDENYSAEARSYLRKVERALEKADKLIASTTPAS